MIDYIHSVFFKDPEMFQKEYNELLPIPTAKESLVFAHNDVHEKNFLHNEHEVKLIDFEYAQLNYRSFDLAMYIGESFFELNDDLPHNFEYHPELVPDFKSNKADVIDVDYVLISYLERFYHKHAERIIPEVLETYPSFEAYLAHELPILKSEVLKTFLHHNFFWALWALVNLQSVIKDPETNEVWAHEEKLDRALDTLSVYFLPNIRTRL